MKRWRQGVSVTVAVAALCTVACGDQAGTSPSISDLKLTSTQVERGKQAGGSFQVTDPDGLAGLKARMKLSGPASNTLDLPVQGATDAMTTLQVPFIFILATAAPAGDYTLQMSAFDGDGNESNALSVKFTAK